MQNITSFTNFKNNIVKKQAVENNTNANPFQFSGKNLKPLAQDTVNFTGVLEFKTALNNADVCSQLHEDAKDAEEYLSTIFSKHFDSLVYKKNEKENGIVDPIEGRIKSPESIQEKIADRIEKALKSPNLRDDIFSPTNKDQIKEKLRDIPGIRIVMRKAYDHHVDAIIDQLCNAIKDEELIIDEIENHVSSNRNIKPYFSDEHLERLKKTVNEVRFKNGLQPIKVKENDGTSGYMALHLDVNLKNIGKYVQNRGFHGELQIIGSDVSMLKDIEDLCYKLKQGKDIKAGHPAYTPFEQFFREVYEDEEQYPNMLRDFEKYTQLAYEAQRDRKPSNDITNDKTNWAYKYPTIKECGLEGRIPPILDFNILARIKRDCDDLYKVKNHAQEILDGKENEISN